MENKNCLLCPRACGADREHGEKGYCGMSAKAQVARASLHMWEEPCISGTKGSGTVFFSGCPLKCVFCQNRSISLGGKGIELSASQLAQLFLLLQEKGANNINLVTPTHFVPQIVQALEHAKREGLTLPIVYNTSSYETIETLKRLEGLVDIYLPDLKYKDKRLSSRYSNAADYFEVADNAIAEMVRQSGMPLFRRGIMQRGVIVRHMVMPGCTKDSREILSHLHHAYGAQIFISIMSQYTPHGDLTGFPELNRPITKREYGKVVNYAIELGIENAFVQEGMASHESFIPDFDEPGLLKEIILS